MLQNGNTCEIVERVPLYFCLEAKLRMFTMTEIQLCTKHYLLIYLALLEYN